jgi:hypothetical protein
VSESTGPETTEPETTEPEPTEPQPTVSESTEPEQAEPEQQVVRRPKATLLNLPAEIRLMILKYLVVGDIKRSFFIPTLVMPQLRWALYRGIRRLPWTFLPNGPRLHNAIASRGYIRSASHFTI